MYHEEIRTFAKSARRSGRRDSFNDERLWRKKRYNRKLAGKLSIDEFSDFVGDHEYEYALLWERLAECTCPLCDPDSELITVVDSVVITEKRWA